MNNFDLKKMVMCELKSGTSMSMDMFTKTYSQIENYYQECVKIEEKHYYYDWKNENPFLLESLDDYTSNSSHVDSNVIKKQLIELALALSEEEEALLGQLLRKWLVESASTIYDYIVLKEFETFTKFFIDVNCQQVERKINMKIDEKIGSVVNQSYFCYNFQ